MNLHVGKQKSEKKTDRRSYRRMDRKNKLARLFLWMAFLFAGVFAVPQMRVWAGDINPDEAGVIAVASGTFEYDGKTYVAYSSYVNKLYNYLSKDGVNLSSAAAKKLINYIYSNVKRGIQLGYIYEVKESTPDTTQSSTENPGNTEEPGSSGQNTENTEDTEDPSSTESTEIPTDSTEQPANSTERDSEKITENTTEFATERNGGGSDNNRPGQSTETPDNTEVLTEQGSEDDADVIIRQLEDEDKNAQALDERVSPDDAEASAVISDDSIVIDTGDGNPIKLDSNERIIPTAWTTGIIIIGIVVSAITAAVCLVLIFTRCMRFRKKEHGKPQRGHSRRRRIRKVCRHILLVTTGVSIAGLFLLAALFVSFFNQGRIERNIQESGYFRYAYIDYLSQNGRSMEGTEFLSDEEIAIISQGNKQDENIEGTDSEKKSEEKLLSYDEFLIREKQATQQILAGNKDVEYQRINVAPYILRLKEDLRPSMTISVSLFAFSLLLGCVFTIFMDLRRDRGVRMIAISDLIGTAFAAALTILLIIWTPAKRLFIEPDYLYLFFKNYMAWIVQVVAVISVLGVIIGMALFGVYITRNKGRNR